jgi:outer membrane immunogenic protein
MRLLPVAVLAVMVLGGAARAGAAPPAAPITYEWNGAYVGAFAGVASGSSDVATSVDCSVNGVLCAPAQQLNNGALIGETASGRATGTAFTGGGFAGHNWQSGGIVYGLEADLGAMPLSLGVGGSANTLNPGLYNASSPGVYDIPSVFTVEAKASTDWLATARVRAGFLPAPNLLVYGTAGIAATELTVSNSYSDNFNNGDGTGSVESSSHGEFRTALVLGVGAEWALARRWTMRVEYLHTDFGALSTTGISTYVPDVLVSNPISSTASLRADLFRLGVAYGF